VNWLEKLVALEDGMTPRPWVGVGGRRKYGVLGVHEGVDGPKHALAVFSGIPGNRRKPDVEFTAAARNVWQELLAVAADSAALHVSTEYPADMEQQCRTCRCLWPCLPALNLAALDAAVKELP
jgi:hypothetical protein